MICQTCQSKGFTVSKLGPTRCTFCDGTEGGNPPIVWTVREWFRVLRGQLWETDPHLASDVDKIATAIAQTNRPPHADCWVRIGSLYWIESVESYQAHERVLALVRDDMRQVMWRHYLLQGITE